MRSLARSQDAYDRFSAAVGLPLTVLALLWLPVVVVPLVVHLPADVAFTFNAIDYVVWAVYAAEYLVRLYLAPSRWRFFTHHLVDLAVVALPLLRPLRALRLLRLLNLARVGAVLANALTRARELFTHRGLNFVLLSVLGIIIVCSGLELAFEQHASGSTIHNFGDAIWWATVTVTTVGYGDMYPVSAGGRGVAVVLMLVGIGLIGVLTATVASYFIEEQADQERADLNQRLDRIEAMLAQALARPDESDLFRRRARPRRAQSSTPASGVRSRYTSFASSTQSTSRRRRRGSVPPTPGRSGATTRRQPRIGQPVAEQDGCRARLASNLTMRSHCRRPGVPPSPHGRAFRSIASNPPTRQAHLLAATCVCD